MTGTGVVHGITNSGSAITMTGYATFILEGANGTHNFDLNAIKDARGFDTTLIATNGHVELDVTWAPSGATRSAAATTAVFIAPLAKTTLANFSIAAFNGDWVYIGGETLQLSATGPAKMSLKLRKYDDSTQNTSLTTTVSG